MVRDLALKAGRDVLRDQSAVARCRRPFIQIQNFYPVSEQVVHASEHPQLDHSMTAMDTKYQQETLDTISAAKLNADAVALGAPPLRLCGRFSGASYLPRGICSTAASKFEASVETFAGHLAQIHFASLPDRAQ